MELKDPLAGHFRLLKAQQAALKRLGITTIQDLLFHFPTRYENIALVKPIGQLARGDHAIVYGKLRNLSTRKAFRRKTPIAEGIIEDASGRLKVIWFHQPYLAKMLPEGKGVKLAGKVTGDKRSLYIANPEVEQLEILPVDSADSLFEKNQGAPTLIPVYPESKGITSKWFYHALARVLEPDLLDTLPDPIPTPVLKRYNLPTLRAALVWIHRPRRERDSTVARKRFAFEEVFLIQTGKLKERAEYQKKPSFQIRVDRSKIDTFVRRFPFEPTKAQDHAIKEILTDLETKGAMSRLLEGDVGSGKTAVAAASVYAVSTTPTGGNEKSGEFGNLQVAYMVPTEILAKQHFDSFISYFEHLPIQIGLITSSGCKKFPSKVDPAKATDISRAQLLRWVANGEIPILVGTHALIQKTVQFENLAYVIIDEQHRFGTVQRQKLVRKDDIAPHLLSMTATPIPRTLALTIYGDLDLTLLDEMPKGRKPIVTEIVLPNKREQTYQSVRKELEAGRQAYVICPRIDPPDGEAGEPDPQQEQALNIKSVKEECARLKREVFPDYRLDILHSKMRPKEKDEVMRQFLAHEIDVLIATSVVEVGVNVPNATMIIIEGAERFGLAQLHQLRGRVLRSTHQAYCFVFADTKGKKTLERLTALKRAKNGFELAEFDLSIRGSGELYGRKQSGLSDIGMEAMKNIKMVEAARKEAQTIVADDPSLGQFPELSTAAARRVERLHFE